MADKTHIEWTDATWNPITGCSVVSPGCTNCYAMKLAGTRLQHHQSRAGLTTMSKAGPVWTGEVRFNEQWLDQPLRWKKPRMIFVCAHGDLFHDDVPDEWIDKVFAVMALCPRHTFQVLTKRPDRMREYLSGDRFADGHASERIGYAAMELAGYHEEGDGTRAPSWPVDHTIISGLIHGPTPNIKEVVFKRPDMWPLPNVWLGVSAEDQARADERIPLLLDSPAAVRWISAEPLLGGINMQPWLDRLDWVVAGGESGSNARPMHPDWARSLRDQCAAAGVAFHFKQWGEWVSVSEVEGDGPHHKFPDGATVRRIGKKAAGRHLDGVTHDAYPRVPTHDPAQRREV